MSGKSLGRDPFLRLYPGIYITIQEKRTEKKTSVSVVVFPCTVGTGFYALFERSTLHNTRKVATNRRHCPRIHQL
jgi:hypothetical protein